MLGFSTYAALLPELRDLWGLSNSQAGLIGGMFFAGYIGTVSLWTALTDRVDGRKVYVAGSALAVAGSAGFGLLAEGLVSAIVLQGLLGAGIAATYMPGLRLLSDRIAGPLQSRYIAFTLPSSASAPRSRWRSPDSSRLRTAGESRSCSRRPGHLSLAPSYSQPLRASRPH
jgi:MFS family permease